MALTWNGKKLDWTNVIYFSVIHAGALLAPWMFSWTALGIALFLYWLTASVGITLTYHRLLTHRGYRIPKPLEYLFTCAACWPAKAARSRGWPCTASTTRSPTAKAATSTRRRTVLVEPRRLDRLGHRDGSA